MLMARQGDDDWIIMIISWLVGFYVISTLVGYLMPNTVYSHIYMYIICK